jgi:hypothetical protein
MERRGFKPRKARKTRKGTASGICVHQRSSEVNENLPSSRLPVENKHSFISSAGIHLTEGRAGSGRPRKVRKEFFASSAFFARNISRKAAKPAKEDEFVVNENFLLPGFL